MSKPVILTGLRANNDLHLGSYLGAMLPMAQLQKKYGDKYQINMFIPDLHSFTTPIDHSKLYEQSMHNLKLFVASGLDISHPDTYIYRQSRVPAHSELTVILNCFTYMGELQRMTQFKEKSATADSISVGLFDYPVLMVADILLYGAKYVPVGADQTQHVELARDIAIRMNNKFNRDLFVPPEPEKQQIAFAAQQNRMRIKDLLDPSKKMSKSDETGKGVIFLGDSPEVGAKKVMSATTDSLAKIAYNHEKQPGISNLIDIYCALSGDSLEAVRKKYEGQTQYGPFKQDVADVVKEFLTEFQSRMAAVDEKALMNKLELSEAAMNQVANKTLHRVQRAVGLREKREDTGKRRGGAIQKPSVVSFSDFSKLDIRIGTVTEAKQVPESDKLIHLTVDIGGDVRSIVTGMREFYSPEDFKGKQMPIIVNLEAQVLKGTESHGMLVAIEGQKGPVFLLPESSVDAGSPLE